MDRKIFALRAPKDLGLRPPGSGDPFSNAHPRHSRGGVATQSPQIGARCSPRNEVKLDETRGRALSEEFSSSLPRRDARQPRSSRRE